MDKFIYFKILSIILQKDEKRTMFTFEFCGEAANLFQSLSTRSRFILSVIDFFVTSFSFSSRSLKLSQIIPSNWCIHKLINIQAVIIFSYYVLLRDYLTLHTPITNAFFHRQLQVIRGSLSIDACNNAGSFVRFKQARLL